MFGSTKSKQKKLELKYRELMQQSLAMSNSNRRKSDQKLAEAEKVRQQLDQLDNQPVSQSLETKGTQE